MHAHQPPPLGAAFSILYGNPGLLAVIASVVLIVIFVYVYMAEPSRRVFLLALALVASGALGNLFDRITLGYVRDFVYFDFDLPFHGFGFGSFRIPQRWPVWNVADMAILTGVGILLILSFKKQPESNKALTFIRALTPCSRSPLSSHPVKKSRASTPSWG